MSSIHTASRIEPSANGTAPHPASVPSSVQSQPWVNGNVPNYCDYTVLLNRMVDTAPPNSWLVEVGIYHGFSLRHLAHRAKAARNNLTVVGVDWGRGSPEHADQMAALPCGNLAGPMLSTLITGGVADDVMLVLAPSVKAAKLVPDGSCHMVFIDGDHSRAGVLADIEAWLPKIKPGSYICGHDWPTFPGVHGAVCDVFGHKNHMVLDCPSCWAVQIGK